MLDLPFFMILFRCLQACYRQHYATRRQPTRLINKLQREAEGDHDDVKRILKTALIVGCVAITGLYILDLLKGCQRR